VHTATRGGRLWCGAGVTGSAGRWACQRGKMGLSSVSQRDRCRERHVPLCLVHRNAGSTARPRRRQSRLALGRSKNACRNRTYLWVLNVRAHLAVHQPLAHDHTSDHARVLRPPHVCNLLDLTSGGHRDSTPRSGPCRNVARDM
jgi:hypothetical protein